MTWQNWAGTASADPVRRYWPRSVEEIANAIKAAADAGLTVRALGSGHSFTPAAATRTSKSPGRHCGFAKVPGEARSDAPNPCITKARIVHLPS